MVSFFDNYYEIAKRSETAPELHMWGSIGLISALLGRKCFIPQGHFTLFPNLYILLVARSGNRKDSAINLPKDLMKSSVNIPAMPNSTTVQALMDVMASENYKGRIKYEINGQKADYLQANIWATEFNMLISSGQSLDDKMIKFFVSVYNEFESFQDYTRHSGKVDIKWPYVTMMGACTPDWLRRSMKYSVLSDGMLRRTLFAYSKNKFNNLIAWPDWSYQDSDFFKELVLDCQRIHKLKGAWDLTEDCLAFYKNWYETEMLKIDDQPEQLKDYWSSRHTMVLKIAMCLSAAYDDKQLIPLNVLESAIILVESLENNMLELFGGAGRNELTAYADKIYKIIQEGGEEGVNHAQVYSQVYSDLSVEELEKAISSLEHRGLVKSFRRDVLEVRYYPLTQSEKSTEGADLFQQVRRARPRYESTAYSNEPKIRFDPYLSRSLRLERERQETIVKKLEGQDKPVVEYSKRENRPKKHPKKSDAGQSSDEHGHE